MKAINNSLTSLLFGIFFFLTITVCHAADAKVIKPDSTKQAIQSNDKIIVYYFHGNARCPTCFKLENFSKSEIEADFSSAMKNKTLEWKAINVDDKENEHFVADYKLYTKSVIVSTIKNGKEVSWKNLDKIWELVHEEPKYRAYIKSEVNACLIGKCL